MKIAYEFISTQLSYVTPSTIRYSAIYRIISIND